MSVESRTRFAIGGMSTVVASVAVVCAVALTNSIALADSVGVPIKASPVIVPSPTASAKPVVKAQPVAGPAVAKAPAVPELPAAEIVPAPAPIVVTNPPPPAAVSQPTAEEAVAEAESSGNWDPVRQWAIRNGWTQERIDAWVQRLEEKHAAAQDRVPDAPKAGAGEEWLTDGRDPWAASESKTSARADENAERQSAKPDVGSKKDQSRDSPD